MLKIIKYELPKTASSASTLTKSIYGELLKVDVKRDSADFTLDVDLINPSGNTEKILDGVSVAYDNVYYPRSSASTLMDGSTLLTYDGTRNIPTNFVCGGGVTVGVSSSDDNKNHRVWLYVDDLK